LKKNLTICLGWLLIVIIALIVIAHRLSTSYDLGVLLPGAKTDAERVLIERVGKSPGANLLFVGIESTDQSLVQSLVDTLTNSPLYSRVINPGKSVDLDDLPELVNAYRYHLDDRALTETFIAEQFETRAKELRLLGGRQFARLVSRDPTLAAPHVLERVAEFSNKTSIGETNSESSVIVVETVAAGFDITAQHVAIDNLQLAIESTFRGAAVDSRISGVGLIGTVLEEKIRHEAQTRSIAASILVILILLLAYRRLGPVLQAGLPVIIGAVVALAVLTTLSDSVHGVTLAFGFTLLGVGIDYPVHYFSHQRRSEPTVAIETIWPTLKLSVVSTLIAYVALSLSGSEGTRQLGIFTVAGLVTIVLATRYLLPAIAFVSHSSTKRPEVSEPRTQFRTGIKPARWSPLAVVATISLLAMFLNWKGQIFDDNLSRLSPVPDELISIDRELRDAAGSPDGRMLIALRADSIEQVLQATERLDHSLGQLSVDGLSDWLPVTRVLPSRKSQQQRIEALPEKTVLTEVIRRASRSVEFNPEMFTVFVDAVQNSKNLDPLLRADYDGSPMEALIRAHLYESEGQWVSLISLHGETDNLRRIEMIDEFETALSVNNAIVIDLKRTSEDLVKRYRQGIAFVLLFAVVAIIALLIRQTTVRRGCWAMSATLVSVFTSASIVYAVHGRLDLYHMIALLLVAGLVLDYALFLSRDHSHDRTLADTRHAILTCAASTTAAFALLATSSIPALHSLGSIVSVGAFVGLGLCWWSTQLRKPACS